MRLTAIDISNFKGLKSGRFDLTQSSCLVGENNAGKSSILQAIVYALNGPAQTLLSLYYDPPVTLLRRR